MKLRTTILNSYYSTLIFSLLIIMTGQPLYAQTLLNDQEKNKQESIIDFNLDSDGDGIPDYLDLDSDNDGILDSVEGSISLNNNSFKLYNNIAYDGKGIGMEKWKILITGTTGTEITYTPYAGAPVKIKMLLPFYEITLTKDKLPPLKFNLITNNNYVSVTSNAPISIIQEIYGTGHNSQDATVVYPETLWGTEYVVNTHHYSRNALNYSALSIFSEKSNNSVSIKNDKGIEVKKFTLNSGDNYIYSPGLDIDISGYSVSSTERVGVTIAIACANGTGATCDNTIESVLPNNFLGTKFLTVSNSDPTKETNSNFINPSKMMITAIKDNTVIKVDGNAVKTLSARQTYHYTQEDGEAQIIETSFPVQFTKLTPSNFDPSISTVQDITKATIGPAYFLIPSTMDRINYLTIFTKTADTNKILLNNAPIVQTPNHLKPTINRWVKFNNDNTYSYITLSTLTTNQIVKISSTVGNVPFLTDYLGKGLSVSDGTPLTIGSYDLSTGNISPSSAKDTDGDGIPDYLDLDSDNDGCVDAIEGGDNVKVNHLVEAALGLSVGTGSSAANRNLCASRDCVDAQGVPLIVNKSGAADLDGEQGQGIGGSIDALIQELECFAKPFCYKPANTYGEGLDTYVGISSLNRSGINESDNWPSVQKGAWMVLESKTKGFVINRVSFNSSGNPIGMLSENFVEGMLVYDTTNNCLRVYTSTNGGVSFSWKCMNTQTCPD